MQSLRAESASLTPPAPPSDIPTPIGAPPLPPTATPTATVPPTVTATASQSSPTTTPTASATATPTATKGPAAAIKFSLDAARVSRVGNPGNLEGLSAIKPGSRVWLMMYFNVQAITKKLKRVTTYEVLSAGKTIFKVTYSSDARPTDLGRFSRYTVYAAPASLRFGHYVFRATLSFGKATRKIDWKFNVAKQEQVAHA